jgi:epoxyqueuosine reductase
MQDLAALASEIKRWSRELGFAQAGIAGVELGEDESQLRDWLAQGMHGEMEYMARHGDKRSRPAELLPGTLRVVSVRMDYGTGDDAAAWDTLADGEARLRRALRAGPRLPQADALAPAEAGDRIAAEVGDFGYRVFVDSAPVLERALARKAGLGWIGKNACLIDRNSGSWFFLGELYTDLPLPVDCAGKRALRHLHALHRYLPDAGDRRAQPNRRAPLHQLPHHRGAGRDPGRVPRAIGNRIFGCDDCQLGLPLEQVRAALRSGRLRRAQCARHRIAGGAVRMGGRGVPAPHRRLGDPPHRLARLAAQHRRRAGQCTDPRRK